MTRSKLIAAAALAGFVFSVPVVNAQESPNTPEKRATEAAKQSPEALRRFVNRTRMVYALSFNDYYKAD